jgi:hypothetical protein
MTLLLPRRKFLKGLMGLIAAPAVVRAEALMPIVVWKPSFGFINGGGGMGTFVTCDKSDLLGVDFTSLGLPQGHDWGGHSDRWYWPPEIFPLASLPRDKVRFRRLSQPEQAILARISGLAPADLASSSPWR